MPWRNRSLPTFFHLFIRGALWVSAANCSTRVAGRGTWIQNEYGRSITEIEIFHAALNDPVEAKHAYFYFRDPKFIERIPLNQRATFVSESQEASRRVNALKRRIRLEYEAGRLTIEPRENYPDCETLGGWILQDFTSLIDALFPASSTPNALDQEITRHNAFANDRRIGFVGRENALVEIDACLSSGDRCIVVVGKSGCGKSALLAEWVSRHRAADQSDCVIQHYIGVTPDSMDWEKIILRFLEEVGRTSPIPDGLRIPLSDWTRIPTNGRSVVLVLDALDHLPDDEVRQLGWLPSSLPPNFHLLASTTAGAVTDAVSRRGWPILELQPLSEREVKSATVAYLSLFGKTLPPAVIHDIVEGESTSNALYLRALVDELRQFGDHRSLHDRVKYYLSSHDPTDLYRLILTRWEYDYGLNLVRRSIESNLGKPLRS